MSKKHFSWLVAVTVVVAALVLLLPERTGRQSAIEQRNLLPDLAAQINDVDRVTVLKAGEEGPQTVAELVRGEGGWSVATSGGYPANWGRLRGVMAALAQAEVLEPKTSNPEYYDQLGVRDMADPKSTAFLVKLNRGESQVAAVLVGKAARDRDGQYVRIDGAEQAMLIDRSVELTGEPSDWMEREIVDVAEDEVVEVEVTHPGAEPIRLSKVSADDEDFALANVPEGREIQSKWTVNALGGALSALQLDGVAPADTIDWTDATRLKVLTADGLQVEADLVQVEEQRWIKVFASAHEPAAASADAPAEDGSDSGTAEADEETSGGAETEAGAEAVAEADVDIETEAETGPETEPVGGEPATADADPETDTGTPEATPAERAAEINQRVSGWAYELPEYKFSVMTRKMEDLLKPLEEE